MKHIMAILVIGLFLISGCSNNQTESEKETITDIDSKYNDYKPEVSEKEKGKVFEVIAQDYKFTIDGVDNPEIRVKKGDNVTIELTSIQGTHNFQINQLAARSKTVMSNQSTTFNFIAYTTGTFEYYCGVSIHERRGQQGTFIVEE